MFYVFLRIYLVRSKFVDNFMHRENEVLDLKISANLVIYPKNSRTNRTKL